MRKELQRGVFMDRDGVINRAIVKNGKPHPPAALAELEIMPKVPESLQRLKAAGFRLICVTNQPDVSRGTQRREVVEAINSLLLQTLPLNDILVCYHDDADGCDCRKPMPGLLTRAAAQYGIDLPSSFMIGDRWKDVEAGRNAGCKTVLIECGYSEESRGGDPDYRVRSLPDAVAWILNSTHQHGATP